MSYIGIELEADQLVLIRGRDFKWTFENLDANLQPVDYPAGDLYFEIQTRGETDAVQSILVTGASGGTYKLGHGGQWTDPIDYNDVVNNPQNLSGDITDALVGLSTIGAGNVAVSPSSLYPVWELDIALNDGNVLTEQIVNTLNQSINTFFGTFSDLLGVTVDFTIHDNLNTVVKVTSNKSFDEVGLITFSVDVVGTALKTILNAVAGMIGIFNTVHVDFYWNHTYQVEFIGDLGLMPQPALATDITDLTAVNDGEQQVEVTILDPGRAPLTLWHFDIDGAYANIKIESENADQIVARTPWQLVFLDEGEAKGGDPLAIGLVKVQGVQP